MSAGVGEGFASILDDLERMSVPPIPSLAAGERMTKKGRALERPAKGKPVPTEGAVQRSILSYLEMAHPRALAWHVKNENDRRLSYGANARRAALGRKRGIPDLTVVFPGPVVVFLEVKRPGGVVSAAQDGRLAHLTMLGCHVGVATSLEEAIEVFRRAGVVR